MLDHTRLYLSLLITTFYPASADLYLLFFCHTSQRTLNFCNNKVTPMQKFWTCWWHCTEKFWHLLGSQHPKSTTCLPAGGLLNAYSSRKFLHTEFGSSAFRNVAPVPPKSSCSAHNPVSSLARSPLFWVTSTAAVHTLAYLRVWCWGCAHTPPELYLHSLLGGAHILSPLVEG